MTRISTATMQQEAVASMLKRQADLSRTQNQVATGKRIQTPADDPAGAVRLQRIQRAIDANAQYDSTATTATNRLTYEEQALADLAGSLQRIQELALQANNSVLDEPTRRLIAAELRTRVDEVIDIGNRSDAGGEYLFAGTRSAVQPFARVGSGVAYYGDGVTRSVALSGSQRIAVGHTGREAFQDIPAGNGIFTTAAAPANTGTAVIDAGALLSRPDWIPDNYTVRFIDAANYEVRNGANTVIASGAIVAGTVAAVEFNGVRVTLNGQPAANDQFNIAPAGRRDLFTTLDRLVGTVESSTTTPAERTQFATAMAASLNQITVSLDHVGEIRAEVGARLAAIDSAAGARAELDVELQRTRSEIQDVDYAEAVSRMNLQLVGLQAAQQSYARIAQLSLFDYL